MAPTTETASPIGIANVSYGVLLIYCVWECVFTDNVCFDSSLTNGVYIPVRPMAMTVMDTNKYPGSNCRLPDTRLLLSGVRLLLLWWVFRLSSGGRDEHNGSWSMLTVVEFRLLESRDWERLPLSTLCFPPPLRTTPITSAVTRSRLTALLRLKSPRLSWKRSSSKVVFGCPPGLDSPANEGGLVSSFDGH